MIQFSKYTLDLINQIKNRTHNRDRVFYRESNHIRNHKAMPVSVDFPLRQQHFSEIFELLLVKFVSCGS